MMIRWACGASDDTHAPRTRTSLLRYRFQAFAEAFFLGGFSGPLPETALRSARDTRTLIADDVPEAEADPEVKPEGAPPRPEAGAVAVPAAPAAPAAVEVPAWLAALSTEPTTDGIEERSRAPPPVGDEELDAPRREVTDDGAGVAGMETLGADTERVVADGTVAEGEVTDGTVATGVLTFGVVTVGVVTFGVVTVGVVTFGVVTVGVVTFGVVTVGVVTVGVVIFGVVTTGVETLGVDTAGTTSLGMLTWGVLTAGALTPGTATAGALTVGTLTEGSFTAEVAGSDWSADATAARMSAKPTTIAARKVRRRFRPARLDPDTTRI